MWRLFTLLSFPVYAGIVIYIGHRCFALLKYFFPAFKAWAFWPVFIVLCFSFVLVFFLRIDALRQAALLSFPIIVYIFFAFAAFDVLKLVLRLLRRLPSAPGFFAAGTGIALGVALLFIVFGLIHARTIRTAQYSISLNKNIGSPLTIALISDLHIGSASMNKAHIARVVDAVHRAQPDIICISGDIFDGGIDTAHDLENKLAELEKLAAPLGVYASLGNHDVDRFAIRSLGDESGTARIKSLLENAGIIVLQDETVLVDGRFYLSGRRDLRPIGLNAQRLGAAELTAGLDTELSLIVMDHQPLDYPELEKAGADLILSGHTHRGQFFPGNVITHFIFKKAGAVSYGYWQGSSSQAVVSSGAGFWGPPVRIGTDSEVAVITLSAL